MEKQRYEYDTSMISQNKNLQFMQNSLTEFQQKFNEQEDRSFLQLTEFNELNKLMQQNSAKFQDDFQNLNKKLQEYTFGLDQIKSEKSDLLIKIEGITYESSIQQQQLISASQKLDELTSSSLQLRTEKSIVEKNYQDSLEQRTMLDKHVINLKDAESKSGKKIMELEAEKKSLQAKQNNLKDKYSEVEKNYSSSLIVLSNLTAERLQLQTENEFLENLLDASGKEEYERFKLSKYINDGTTQTSQAESVDSVPTITPSLAASKMTLFNTQKNELSTPAGIVTQPS